MTTVRTAWVVLVAASAAFAQEGHVTASAPSWNGMEIWFVTKIEPPGTQIPGGVVVESGRVHRIIRDQAHKTVFGYDVTVEPGGEGQGARLRIESFHPADSKISYDREFHFLELPKYPTVSDVQPGDTVALDILVNASTGQKVVDYLTLKQQGDMDTHRAPRDFSLSDVELTVRDPQITVNGKPEPEMGAGGFSGAVVWLYVPGHGRFILSLVPNDHLGFLRNGVVSGHGLLFHNGPVEVRVECRTQVAPGSGVYNLYTLHQPGWHPSGRNFPTIGSADKAEYIIGKK